VAAAGVDNLSVGLCVVLNANETRSFDKDSPDPAPGSASARNLFHLFSFYPMGNQSSMWLLSKENEVGWMNPFRGGCRFWSLH
jgi:hypothetical protein